tara:strand:+ start:419 stop:1162 length:744 start_codon:yes stop_codon:yes gene_type:complete
LSLERIWPTQENLNSYLEDYPEHRIRYELINRFIQGKKCADISCGVGYGAFLLGKTAQSVKGFDISEEALDHANNNFKSSNVSFHYLNNLQNEKFEFISSIETLEHMNETEGDEFLKKLRNAMTSSATLIISTPLNETRFKENTTEFHIREYSFVEFKNKLESNGFIVNKFYGISNITSERMSSKVMGLSLIDIFQTGLHRIIPKFIRNFAAKLILKKNPSKPVPECKLLEDNIHGSFCQIAICKLK